MFSKLICVLVLCLVQVYANEDESCKEKTTYCGCKSDVAAAKKCHEDKYDYYFSKIGPIQKDWESKIEDKVAEMNQGKCHNDYYQKTKREIVYDMLSICHGGTALRHNYDPVWRNDSSMSDDQVCNYIATKYHIMCKYVKHNLDVIASCSLEEIWEGIWKNYQQCSSNCTEGV